MSYSLPLARLIEEFQKLPGIGPKSAQRLAFHVLKQPESFARGFSEALLQAKEKILYCQVCFNMSSQSPCEICANKARNHRQICVVAEPRDLFALERTGEYKGVYHVLDGMISPLEGVGPDDLRLRELVHRLAEAPFAAEETPKEPVEEVILALPPSIEGDTTTLYITKLLKPLGVLMSRIAFGLPAGGELEYADSMTITRALQGRVTL